MKTIEDYKKEMTDLKERLHKTDSISEYHKIEEEIGKLEDEIWDAEFDDLYKEPTIVIDLHKTYHYDPAATGVIDDIYIDYINGEIDDIQETVNRYAKASCEDILDYIDFNDVKVTVIAPNETASSK